MAQQPRIAVESIPGKRPYQEDSVFADLLSDGRALVAVADGMGGHAAGEVASALALRTLQDALAEGAELGDAFRRANERVHQMATEPGKQGMGTTMVAVLIDGAQFRVANVGDSRIYLISASGIRQVTEDHSFVAEAMKRGQSKAEAMATPWRDALTRSIGTDEEVEVDVFGPFPLEGDSAFVVCSDGLYKTLSDDDLRDLFVQSGGPRGAAQAMVTAAFDGGSDDNISVAIAEYGQVPRDEAPKTQVPTFDANAVGAESTESAAAPLPREVDQVTAAVAAEEGAFVRGLPVTAVVAVAVVVAVVVAILVFGS
ncbi:MAG: serine/threonine-protein phosphatase [Gemmatimonadetes bacterium]|nr:serine/threonine-protein phosphatase [Gemmatimonadota bacterium]